MTAEKTISGYCRANDQSRMVMLEYDPAEGVLEDVDCDYLTCPYAKGCTIGMEIARTAPEV